MSLRLAVISFIEIIIITILSYSGTSTLVLLRTEMKKLMEYIMFGDHNNMHSHINTCYIGLLALLFLSSKHNEKYAKTHVYNLCKYLFNCDIFATEMNPTQFGIYSTLQP